MSVLRDLATLLQTEGVGTIGTNIFMSERPDNPDDLIALTDYQGEASRLHGPTNIPADERISVQVMTRSYSYETAKALAESAYTVLHFRHATLQSGRDYAWSKANQRPAYVGVDDKDRKLVSFNLRLRRHRTTDLV